MTSINTLAVSMGAKIARSSLQMATTKLTHVSDVSSGFSGVSNGFSGVSDAYVHIESAAHDNIKARNKFPTINYEKKFKKGNKKTMERDKERREKYANVVEHF